jgi:hypothetical protein
VKPHKLNQGFCIFRMRISSDIFRSGYFFYGGKKIWVKKIPAQRAGI